MSIDGIERRPYETKTEDDHLPPHPTEVPTDRMPTNRELDDAFQSITYGVDYGFDPPNNSATFLTTDKKSEQEGVANLKSRTGESQVETIAHAKNEGVLEHAGKKFDLNTEKGREAFATQLSIYGLPSDKAHEISNALKYAPKAGRDEIAGLALSWMKAEINPEERVPPRLVLANQDQHTLDAVQQVARAMPRAASQILAVEVHDAKSGDRFDQTPLENDWYAAFPNMRAMEQFSRFEHHRSLRM